MQNGTGDGRIGCGEHLATAIPGPRTRDARLRYPGSLRGSAPSHERLQTDTRRPARFFDPGGFAPADPPTRSLAGAPYSPLRSRDSLAPARSFLFRGASPPRPSTLLGSP